MVSTSLVPRFEDWVDIGALIEERFAERTELNNRKLVGNGSMENSYSGCKADCAVQQAAVCCTVDVVEHKPNWVWPIVVLVP